MRRNLVTRSALTLRSLQVVHPPLGAAARRRLPVTDRPEGEGGIGFGNIYASESEMLGGNDEAGDDANAAVTPAPGGPAVAVTVAGRDPVVLSIARPELSDGCGVCTWRRERSGEHLWHHAISCDVDRLLHAYSLYSFFKDIEWES